MKLHRDIFNFRLSPLMHELFFRRFSGYNLRYAFFVYQLIDAALIGNFFQ